MTNKDKTNGQKDLSLTATKEQREEFKNTAVLVRESGKYMDSISLFDQVLAWDSKHENYKGYIDALGHKKIALTLLADTSGKDEALTFLSTAASCVSEAIDLGKTKGVMTEGQVSIQLVHQASLLVRQADLANPDEKENSCLKALESLDLALKALPGSLAHRAWPLGIKAKALCSLGRIEEAFRVLLDAKLALFNGYSEELTTEQGSIKLDIWSTGLDLVFAEVYTKAGQKDFATYLLNSVISSDKSKVHLNTRREQAHRQLKKLS